MNRPLIPLSTLVSPLSPELFLRDYWAHKPIVTHGRPARFRGLLKLPALATTEAFLRFLGRQQDLKVKAWSQDRSGKALETILSSRSAKSAYEKGHITLVTDDLDRRLPEIRDSMHALVKDLKTPQIMYQCNAYLSPPGVGSPLHWDDQEVFLIQLHGEKEWTIAPNPEIRFAHSEYFAQRSGLELAPSFIPPKKNLQTILLKPGSVLFLPRGYWHGSRTIKESFALTLTFESQCWAGLILEQLRAKLLAKEMWRMPCAEKGQNWKTLMSDLKKEIQRLQQE